MHRKLAPLGGGTVVATRILPSGWMSRTELSSSSSSTQRHSLSDRDCQQVLRLSSTEQPNHL